GKRLGPSSAAYLTGSIESQEWFDLVPDDIMAPVLGNTAAAMKILILVTEDWYFWSHRLGLARKIRQTGAEVIIMTHVNQLGTALRDEGFGVIPWQLSRGSLNPGLELSAFLQVLRVYRSMRPDLVHHVALKSVVYGGLAAQMCGGLPTVNA